ncbi:MAG: ComEC/Rec2 family competence protein [Rickettsiales bacterium]|nr:ComEC/Rec2 family competence protein [Rickettsiales bacterium]
MFRNKLLAKFITNSALIETADLWLFFPVLFGFGAAFYLVFAESFLANFFTVLSLFFAAIIFSFLNRDSPRFFVLLACALFLLGSFYVYFYQKIFLNYTPITGKIYVDVIGKIAATQKFYNPKNGVLGLNLLISQPKIYRTEFLKENKQSSKKNHKKKFTKKNNRQKKINKIKQKNFANIAEVKLDESEILTKKLLKNLLKKKPSQKKNRATIFTKKIEKNFVNIAGLQEIDRQFLDYSKNYQHVEWLKIKDRQAFPKPPPKISVNIIKNFQQLKVNDVIAFRAMLQPKQAREFVDDFDSSFADKFKKIGAYGFVLGEAKILRQSEISNIDDWFLQLREKIRQQIQAVINGDEGAIALAFLLGDQSQISKAMMVKIRNSGLAHLLSISGFHLALASLICFTSTRFILSRSEYLTLRFDLKKIAAVTAIFGTYFYLQIAAAPLPAQRAFLMIIAFLSALLLDEKVNAKRTVMTAALILILLNPYALFNISFQLSFAAILVLICFGDNKNLASNNNFLQRIFSYFWQIIFLSIAIQIFTAPFLMRSFQSVSLLGFIANIMAIPLTSFLIMPLGFLALILMPFGLEKYFLYCFGKTILWLEKIIIFVADLNYSNFVSPTISSFGLVLAILGLLIFTLLKTPLRFLGLMIFACSFLTIFFTEKPQILFDNQQKFFAIYDGKNLVFSKNLRPSKQRDLWMKKFNQSQFKSLENTPQKNIFCDEKKCEINFKSSEEDNFSVIRVLLKRNKISEICKNNFKNNLVAIVNLTRKYKLPQCFESNVIKIDNLDFYKKGGHFFFINGKKVLLKTTF